MEPRVSIITLGVEDLDRSRRFYTDLGFATSAEADAGIVFFRSSGVTLALYPWALLAADATVGAGRTTGFRGITLAHNTRSRDEVDEVLALAVEAGASLVKPAGETEWGGYSGYFADPDGHLWEVAHADSWEFHPDGSLVIG